GLLEVIQNGKLLGEMCPGTVFGELAILYNCKRTATVKAVSQSHIWALDRQTFQTIMMRTTKARHEEYFSFLCSVPLLQGLPEEKLAKIVDCLEVDYFEKGEHIIREGEEGNTFFIIAKGEVIVTQSTEGFAEPKAIKTLGVGDYFGEKALISEDVRSANIICNENDTHCLVVDRDNFNQMVGTYEELQTYLKEYVEELSRSDERRNALPHSPQIDSAEAQELRRLKEKIAFLPPQQPFQELEVIATLGMGGFGRVELADFGFAKKIGLGKKTWTFCGTPEYVAPEVIMNKGHDFGADCWSLGILIFELLTGNPPFAGSDPIKIYTMVLHGIEKVDFPKEICKRPDDLIRRLCKLNPVERLGNKKNGIIDIKKHKWFQGFNWEGLRHHKLLSPLKRE
ncbi:cGMP-dependent protein kinase 2, partial [Larimichthys crocea]